MLSLPIHAANPGPFTGAGNWTYLIPGPEPVLIDAGVGDPRHLDDVAEAAPRGPSTVLVTHAHPDHASGAPAIRGRWPAARFAKHAWPERDGAIGVPWDHLGHRATVRTNEGDLEAIHTPGHAPDHLVFWHAASRTAFVGDLLVLGGTVVIPASSGGSLVEYLDSLRRVLELGPRRAWPAHGPVIDDPAALIEQYVDHRGRREQQVLAALGPGPRSVNAIAAAIYTELTPALMPMARESVLAHLVKLEHDGLARRDGEEWMLTR